MAAIIERRDTPEGYAYIAIYPDDEHRIWRNAHTISIGLFDFGAGGVVPPEPRMSLLTFNGGVADLPAYIAGVQEVERQALAVRAEMHAAFEANLIKFNATRARGT